MDRLFGRKWRVVAGLLDVSALDLSFTIAKSLKPEPNTLALTIYNLSQASRDLLSSPKALTVSIEAGYDNPTDKPSLLYLGPTRSAVHRIEGPDIVTTIESADSQKALGTSRFKISMGAGTPPATVLNAIALELGVKLGNVKQAAAKLAKKGKILFPVATTIKGSTSKILTDFCASANLEWSVQDGELQILDLGKALETMPYILNSDTGLIGSPTLDKDGVVSCQALMLHGVRPGSRVKLDSRFVKGLYRVEECEYSADTRGDDWYVSMVCKPEKKGA